MILIISSLNDRTTHSVCRWLVHFKKKFLVLHYEDELSIETISNENCRFSIRGRKEYFDTMSITSYWYRRDNLSFVSSCLISDIHLQKFVNRNLRSDLSTVTQFVHRLLSKTNKVGSYFNASVNKLEVISLAKSQGLIVPEYLYTGSKEELTLFMKKNPNLIFKTPSPGVHDTFDDVILTSLTKVLSADIYNSLPDKFGLTFFQKQIQKKYEIRTFYLNKRFYSVALVSQMNEKTQIDYRNYDSIKPNRTIPYDLPFEIEQKLESLLNRLNMDTCSIDFMYTHQDEFHFLEINPIGQFGNVSFHRNAFLERELALYLN